MIVVKYHRKRVNDLYTDVGGCMMSGGKLLNQYKINQYEEFNKQSVSEAFKSVEAVDLGLRENEYNFKFRDDLN